MAIQCFVMVHMRVLFASRNTPFKLEGREKVSKAGGNSEDNFASFLLSAVIGELVMEGWGLLLYSVGGECGADRSPVLSRAAFQLLYKRKYLITLLLIVVIVNFGYTCTWW